LAFGGGAAVLTTTLAGAAGASFGSIVSALVARDIPNHELKGFQKAIYQGSILLILDIPTKRVDEIKQLINKTHPEAQIGMVKA
jgi:hypothetical protein